MDRRFHNSLFFIELVPNAHLPNRCKTGVLVICCLFSFLTFKAEGQTNWNEGQVRFDFSGVHRSERISPNIDITLLDYFPR